MDAPEKNPAAVALGRLGGASRSAAKRAASARNGAAGGRPRRVFRFPEFAPGFDHAYELRVGDEVVPISTRRPGEEPSWSLSRDPTILAHGVSLPGGRRHRGASVSAAGVATVAHGLHRVAAIEWTSRPLPRTMPADRREALCGRERVLVVRVGIVR